MVSVLIPNYNHAAFLSRRIESILNQTFQDFELIIMDDCSTDNSRQIIEQYRTNSKVTNIVYNTNNSGSTFAQWNKGVECCNGDIIWIAESDDFADETFLSVLVPKLYESPQTGIVYCQSYQVNENDEVTRNWKEWTDDLNPTKFETDFCMAGTEYIKEFLIHKNTIPNASAVLFRKKLYKLTGGADENIVNCSDWLTWLKISLESNVCFVAQSLNYFRHHENSVIAKAGKKMDLSRYVEKYARPMRLKLKQLLKSQYPEEKRIIRENNSYIYKEYGDEGLFHIYRNDLLNGWKILSTAMINSDVRLYYFKSALLQSLKRMTRLK